MTPNGDVLVKNLNFEVSCTIILNTSSHSHCCDSGEIRYECVGVWTQWMGQELSVQNPWRGKILLYWLVISCSSLSLSSYGRCLVGD